MAVFKKIFVATTFLFMTVSAWAQQKVTIDSNKTIVTTTDTTQKGIVKKVKVYDPKKAVFLSAIFPGLGQIYNKKYWKLPIVYGAMGISAGVFIYNFKNYKDTRFAYQAKYKASQPNATAADSVNYFKIKPPLERYSLETLKYYRDSFRKDIDYSVLVFILFWGLNVVDAAVDAHLKAFDVSPDLSLKIKPGHSQMAGTNGVSLILALR
jgi:hypothetical protein